MVGLAALLRNSAFDALSILAVVVVVFADQVFVGGSFPEFLVDFDIADLVGEVLDDSAAVGEDVVRGALSDGPKVKGALRVLLVGAELPEVLEVLARVEEKVAALLLK